jgi:tetratricopeptide (TPR) repeat protein
MYGQIPARIHQAVQHFQAGRLAEADALLNQVLSAQPRNFDALHILGVIKAMQGHRDQAMELFRKALAINKNHSFLQFNMAKALSDTGRDAEALVHHRRATQLRPDHAEAWLNYGLSLMNLKEYQDAALALEKAIQVSPGYAAAWCNLGMARCRLGNHMEGLDALDRALILQPDLAEAHNNKGIVLDELERGAESLVCYERALQINPAYAEASLNKAVKLADLNRHEEALTCFDRAIELSPLPARAWNYKATSQLSLGQVDEAIASYRHALTIQPDYPSAAANLGRLLVQTGDFSAGWELLEQRWQSDEEPALQIQTQRPRWCGASSDRPILLWGEQGIGDQILYGSILPELLSLPQKKLIALDSRLIPLFSRSIQGFEFIDLAQVSDALDFAAHLPLGSLPRLFRQSIESFSTARHPYLFAERARVAELRTKIAPAGKVVCGVSWSSTRKFLGKHKSISLEQLLLPLASDRFHFVNLQYGDTVAERQALQNMHGITVQDVSEVDAFHDIDGLAALIAACDIVVSTSNMTLPLFRGVLNPRLTRHFCAVPRTSVARTASG